MNTAAIAGNLEHFGMAVTLLGSMPGCAENDGALIVQTLKTIFRMDPAVPDRLQRDRFVPTWMVDVTRLIATELSSRPSSASKLLEIARELKRKSECLENAIQAADGYLGTDSSSARRDGLASVSWLSLKPARRDQEFGFKEVI